MSESARRALVVAASARYAPAGRSAVYFARGKLGHDPMFMDLLARGLLPGGGRLLDLGCGRGLLAAWLEEALALHRTGHWPANWPAPPAFGHYLGIEQMESDVAWARAALSPPAEVVQGDIRTTPFPPAKAIVLLDVLHYVPRVDQALVLGRVHSALESGGTLLLRVGDAGGGPRFRLSASVDRLVASVRGRRLARLYCRSLAEWLALLAGEGFEVRTLPINRRTPFADRLLIARIP